MVTAKEAEVAKPSFGANLAQYAGVYLLLFLVGSEAFLISPLLPTIASDLRTSEQSAATVVTAYVLAYAVTSPFLGAVSDRFGRRPSLLAGTVLFVVGNLVAALAGHLAVLIVARGVSGLGAAMAGPSIWAHIAETAPPERRGRAIGIGGGFFAAGQVLGVPIGTFVAAWSSWHATFGALAVLALVALAVVYRQMPKPAAVRGGGVSLAGVFKVWTHRVISHALVVTILLQAANLGAYSFLGTLLQQRFGLSVQERGYVGLLVGVGSFVGSLLAGRLGDRARRAGGRGTSFLPVWCLVLGAGIVAAAFGPVVWISLAAVLIWFLASGAFGTDQQTLLVSSAPDLRATSASWNSSTMYIGTAAGVSLVGLVIPIQQGMALVGGLLAVLATLVAAALAVRIRRIDRAAADA